MAQTNYTPISLYYSTTASAVPTAANLVPGELAINTNDGKLYYEDSSGVVQVLATKSTGSIGGSNTQVQFNNSGSLGGSSSFTWDGTTVTATKFAGALNGTVGATTASTGAFTTLSTSSTTTFSGLTASTALALDASKNVVSVTNTGTGNNVLSASPTLTGTIAGASLSLSSLTSGRVPYATTAGLLTDSANLLYSGTDLTVYGVRVGRGGGAFASNTAVGASALTTNSSGLYNTAIGSFAMQNNTSGATNVAIGYDAFSANLSGSDNVGVGVEAFNKNTSGSSNTAIGRAALYNNISASSNTAVGYQAGYLNQTGSNIVAIGYKAGYSQTVGENVLIGNNAGQYVTTGTLNTAVGVASLGFNSVGSATTGSNNCAYGEYSLTYLTSGSDNVALGLNSGFANTSGSYNVSVGSGALRNTNTASYNTAVGYQAGFTASTADYNTFIGYYAGRSTTGDQNTFLGKFAGNAVTSGATNTIVGAYNGNQASLDIRTASNYTVISDGGGTPHLAAYAGGTVALQGAIPNAGGGITFRATASVSSNANTLDDYEEGTWTPTLTFGGGTTGITYAASYNTASYTKIGSRVFVSGITILTNKGSSTGNAYLSGLPFPADGVSAFTAVACSLANITFTGQYAMELDANADLVYFFQTSALGVQTNLTNTNFSNTSQMVFNFSYYTSS
jgi:hypothetical protein